MSGISGVGGLSGIRFEAEYAARVAKLQKDAVDLQGKLSLQLIAASTGDTGQNFDVSV